MTSLPDSLDAPLGVGRSAQVFPHGPEHVLKLYRTSSDAAAIANEFAATTLAHAHGLPVPRAVALIEREGRTGIVFEAVQGETLLRAHRRRPIALLMALGRLAALHRAINAEDGGDLPSQHDALRRGIRDARVLDAVKRAALSSLQSLPRGDRLCHGDLHPENVLWTRQGLRIIDWQKATRGNPAGDIARSAILLRYGRVTLGPLGRYLPLGAIRAGLAWLYVGACCRSGSVTRADVAAWHLPLLVARLAGQVAPNEAELQEAAARLARPATCRVSASFVGAYLTRRCGG